MNDNSRIDDEIRTLADEHLSDPRSTIFGDVLLPSRRPTEYSVRVVSEFLEAIIEAESVWEAEPPEPDSSIEALSAWLDTDAERRSALCLVDPRQCQVGVACLLRRGQREHIAQLSRRAFSILEGDADE